MPLKKTSVRPFHPQHRFALFLALALMPKVASAQLPAGTWQYAWGDDFSGTAVDTAKWNVASPGWTMPNSASVAAADKVGVATGILTLDATRTATSGTTQFSSGSVSTYQKKNFNGAYIEARIWLPDTPGSWPAFWGLYDGWPPEMDIMEYPIDTAAGSGYAQNQYHTAFHYVNTSGANAAGAGQVTRGSDLGGAWHTFGANWLEDSSVTFYLDGQQVSSFSNGTEVAEMASMYLILDYAVGGWPGTPSTTEWPLGFTDKTKVDWVRVWNSTAAKTSNWTYTGTVEDVFWDTAGNWSNGVPNISGVTSSFGSLAAASQRLDWSGTRMLSVINLDGGTRYRFGGSGDRLILGYGNGGAIQPAINLAATTSSAQEVLGDLEWSGTLALNNNSNQLLLLTGKMFGGDGIQINGSGVVSFDGNANSYSGTTVIDSGTAGPGIARARGQNSLGNGTVVIGETGNGTTGRLELENNVLLSNPLSLNGRTNDSDGIRNNSGTNTLSGTITAQTGGDRYWLQSDGGELRLNGNIALTAASGTRTFTLRGTGNGIVGGVIQNGGGTVNLTKSGSGSWMLGDANTYSGTTLVSQGTLMVDGSTGTGATTVANGGTLAGHGLVKSGLTAQSGSTIRVGTAGFPLKSQFDKLDDFDSYPAGATTAATGGIWNGEFVGTGNSNIVASDGGMALQTKGGVAWRGGETDLTRWNAGIGIGETATIFFRMKAVGTGAYDIMTGLSPSVANIDITNAWQDFAVMPFVNGTAGSNLAYKMSDAGLPGDVIFNMSTDVWYNVWLVVNNATQRYSVYWSTGTNSATPGGTATIYRNGFTNTALNALAVMASGGNTTSLLVDQVHRSGGSNVTYPLLLLTQAETLNVAGDLTLSTGATLELDVSTGTLHDKLVVGGQLNASGTLKVALDPAQPAPVLGDTFDLFDNVGGTIAFANLDLPPLAPGLEWDSSSIATGVLGVVPAPSGYAKWAAGKPFATGTDGPSFDVEPDGIPNAFEWVFGSDPFLSDTSNLPQPHLRTVAGGEFPGADPAKRYLSITATVLKVTPGMSLIPQAAVSPDLLDAPGSSDDIVSIQLDDLGDSETREWILTVPVEDSPRAFMRLKLVGE